MFVEKNDQLAIYSKANKQFADFLCNEIEGDLILKTACGQENLCLKSANALYKSFDLLGFLKFSNQEFNLQVALQAMNKALADGRLSREERDVTIDDMISWEKYNLV